MSRFINLKKNTQQIILLWILFCSSCYSSEDQVRIIYLPFEAETYEPVKLHSLKDQADCDILIDKTDIRLRKISEIVIRKKGEVGFDYLFVRGKISNLIKGVDIFFDKYQGVLLTGSYDAFILNKEDFNELKKQLLLIIEEHKEANCVR